MLMVRKASDLLTLKSKTWLNDGIVNGYNALIMDKLSKENSKVTLVSIYLDCSGIRSEIYIEIFETKIPSVIHIDSILNSFTYTYLRVPKRDFKSLCKWVNRVLPVRVYLHCYLCHMDMHIGDDSISELQFILLG